MKSREKRTTTEPGLGKVDGEARRTAIRERTNGEAPTSAPPTSEAPTSAPPISTPPLSARQTRALEGVSVARPEVVEPELDEPPSTKPVDTQALAEQDRIERVERVERVEGVERVERRPMTIREEPTTDSRELKPAQPSSRPIEGRPLRPSRAPEPKPVSSKPPRRALTSRPPKAGSIPPPRSVRPAKSARASIRVDDVGAAVKSGADAIGVAGRQVPKIVRTKDEIAEAPIDHRAGFLLAHIDGVTTVQGLVDIAGMPESQVHEILDRLRRLGIVTIR